MLIKFLQYYYDILAVCHVKFSKIFMFFREWEMCFQWKHFEGSERIDGSISTEYSWNFYLSLFMENFILKCFDFYLEMFYQFLIFHRKNFTLETHPLILVSHKFCFHLKWHSLTFFNYFLKIIKFFLLILA